jgi:hypothetical protein
MALQGHGLQVEESDLRRAEQLGDMQRREPAWRPGNHGVFHRKNMGKKWRFHPEIGELAGKHWDF